MKIVVVAGFLGSGKTTILLEIAKRLVAEGHSVAVVENEVGEVGIDGRYVAENGFLVQELFGGCICCTLTVGLVAALEEFSRTYSPDYVLVEPTGVAQPAELVDAVRQYSTSEHAAVVTVLDAARYTMLSEVIGPLLEGQVAQADVVVVNKCDAVDRAEVAAILEAVSTRSESTPIVTTCATDRSSLDSVLGMVR